MARLVYADESYKIIGACFAVYKAMGCGFLEAVYQECLEIEFENRNIPFVSQQNLKLTYCNHDLKQRYTADFVCYERIIVELKAVSEITDQHRGQIINYLNATKMKLGLLINFGYYPKLAYERLVLTK